MATFGKTTIGGATALNANQVQWANARTLSEAGTITKLTAYLDNPNASAQNITAGIWADSAGVPGALLGQSSIVNIAAGAAAGWVDFTLVTPYVAAAGTYWLGLFPGTISNQSRRYVSTGASGVMKFRSAVASGPSNPFGTASNFTDDVSVYATYTPASITYSDSPSGTETLAGTLSETYTTPTIYSDSPGGTETLSGSISELRTIADVRTGSISLAGLISESVIHTATVAGTVTLSGSTSTGGTFLDSVTGSIILAGSVSETLGRPSLWITVGSPTTGWHAGAPR